jgi:quercetin dioxygenase-like cupin family protein
MENTIAELEYVQGKVKNKTLFQKEGVRIAVISICAGDQLAAHSAPEDVMVIGLEGDAEVTLSGVKYHLQSHQNICFPAKAVHSIHAITNFKMLLIK